MDMGLSSPEPCTALSTSLPQTSESTRKRILRECAEPRQKRKRAGTPWSSKPPPPGTSVWDMHRSLEEVPIVQAKRKHLPAWDSLEESHCRTSPWKAGRSSSSTCENDPHQEEVEPMSIELESKIPPWSQSHMPTLFSGTDGIEMSRVPSIQRESRLNSQEQLADEVKGIYSNLVLVEKKCIEIHLANSNPPSTALSNEQWQALLALHRTLLREQEDFLLASNHPLASEALRKLARRDDLPGRLWRNSSKAFLENLHHRVRENVENIIAYVYLSYAILRKLDARLPELRETWLECMHDLETYRDFLERIRVTGPGDDTGFPPSSAAHRHLPGHLDEKESPSGNECFLHTASRPPARGIQQYFPLFSGKEYVNWLCGASGTDLSDAFHPPLLLSDNFGQPTDDEINIQKEFDCWFGGLNPHLFDTEGKSKWVLLGWLHFGKHIASSFWSYRRVFKVLLLNVLL